MWRRPYGVYQSNIIGILKRHGVSAGVTNNVMAAAIGVMA